ncbi:ABC transporter permease subunit [Alkalimonas sp. MEB108]|uniref:ABC transporter permease subunit n=1 Tax=Alkalimonas cellulosilytica TaxID=3058395 RepID=A0ABU7J537_9GAMM|nr:ABC transporter permease subunit [Alkalimonas sp. MEB108]MEE2001601.1 ABC transporter permease subunit [Alkalimonas sp. MEB108]
MAKFQWLHQKTQHGPLSQLWDSFRQQHAAVVGLMLFGFFTLIALFGPLLTPYDPYLQNPDALLLPPSWDDLGDVRYLLGTDDLGRDQLSRLIKGASYTFGIALVTALGALLFGLLLGVLAGMSKGFRASAFNHVLDLALTIPSLLLAIIIVAILGPGLVNTIWAIMLALLPQFVHGIRNTILQQLEQEYVIAYRLDGANNWQILRYVILPNTWEQLTVLFSMALSTAILDIAALGFLGLGAQAPAAEWGLMVADALDLIYLSPWSIALPGLLIFIAVLSVNLVSDGLRTAVRKRQEN